MVWMHLDKRSLVVSESNTANLCSSSRRSFAKCPNAQWGVNCRKIARFFKEDACDNMT